MICRCGQIASAVARLICALHTGLACAAVDKQHMRCITYRERHCIGRHHFKRQLRQTNGYPQHGSLQTSAFFAVAFFKQRIKAARCRARQRKLHHRMHRHAAPLENIERNSALAGSELDTQRRR